MLYNPNIWFYKFIKLLKDLGQRFDSKLESKKSLG